MFAQSFALFALELGYSDDGFVLGTELIVQACDLEHPI